MAHYLLAFNAAHKIVFLTFFKIIKEKVMLNLKKMFLLLCFSFLSGFFLIGQAAAATLSFSPVPDTIMVGETVQVDIRMDDLAHSYLIFGGDPLVVSDEVTCNLTAYDLYIGFDYSVLSFDSYVLGSSLGITNDYSSGEFAEGEIYLGEWSFSSDFSFQDDSFLLASIFFTGKEAGVSSFEDLMGTHFYSDFDGLEIFVDIVNSPIIVVADVEPVPEPATMILLGSGLLGLVFSRKKRSDDKMIR